jgi:MFS family permease
MEIDLYVLCQQSLVKVLRIAFGTQSTILADSDFRVLMFANAVGVLGVVPISPLLDSLAQPFGVTDAQIGLLVSAFTAPPILAIPIIGLLVDSIGRKPVLLSGLMLFGLGGVAIPFTTNFPLVVGLRAVQGFGFAAIIPVVIIILGDLYNGNRGETAQGLRISITGLVAVISPLITGVLIGISWQYPFVLYFVAFPVTALVAVAYEDPSRINHGQQSSSSLHDQGKQLYQTLWQPGILAILLARTLPPAIWFTLMTYNSFIVMRLLNGSPQLAGLLVACGSLAFAVSATQVGRFAAAVDDTLLLLGISHLSLGGGFSLVSFAPTLPVAFLGAVITGLGFGVTQSLYRSVLNQISPEPVRGSVVSLGETLGRAVITVTPVFVGAVISQAVSYLSFELSLRWTCLGVALIVTVSALILLAIGAQTMDESLR